MEYDKKVYPNFTKAQKQQARQMSTLNYLKSLGYTFKKVGQQFRGCEHDSLVIMRDERGWYWNSRGIGGSNVLDFKIKIEHKEYIEALNELLGGHQITVPPATSTRVIPAVKPKLELPPSSTEKYSRLFAYLTKTRQLSPAIISELVKEKRIYQDTKGNVVFVGYDKNKPAYASLRGTLSGKQFRGDCIGSDKTIGFVMEGTIKNKVYVFESPIDAISHASIANIICKRSDAWTYHTRIAEGGLNDLVLNKYLKAHPEVKEINLCFDNDYNSKDANGNPKNWGQEFAKKVLEKYTALGYTVINCPPKAKDYNDDLINKVTNRQAFFKAMTP